MAWAMTRERDWNIQHTFDCTSLAAHANVCVVHDSA